MIHFIKTEITDTIKQLRAELYTQLTAPIDAMWELLYISSSHHYLIQKDDTTIGYCCINDDACLNQLFLKTDYLSLLNTTVAELIEQKLIKSASLSSNFAVAFNSCLHHSTSIKTNTLCFEHVNKEVDLRSDYKLNLVTAGDIPLVKAFLLDQLGMDDTFGYTENLVDRKEIFMLKEDDKIVATSERRISDSQAMIADIGIIVNREFQGRGIATEIMKMQVNRVLSMGRKPICSTTVDNMASRKAIEKSGFYCSNILFDLAF